MPLSQVNWCLSGQHRLSLERPRQWRHNRNRWPPRRRHPGRPPPRAVSVRGQVPGPVVGAGGGSVTQLVTGHVDGHPRQDEPALRLRLVSDRASGIRCGGGPSPWAQQAPPPAALVLAGQARVAPDARGVPRSPVGVPSGAARVPVGPIGPRRTRCLAGRCHAGFRPSTKNHVCLPYLPRYSRPPA